MYQILNETRYNTEDILAIAKSILSETFMTKKAFVVRYAAFGNAEPYQISGPAFKTVRRASGPYVRFNNTGDSVSETKNIGLVTPTAAAFKNLPALTMIETMMDFVAPEPMLIELMRRFMAIEHCDGRKDRTCSWVYAGWDRLMRTDENLIDIIHERNLQLRYNPKPISKNELEHRVKVFEAIRDSRAADANLVEAKFKVTYDERAVRLAKDRLDTAISHLQSMQTNLQEHTIAVPVAEAGAAAAKEKVLGLIANSPYSI